MLERRDGWKKKSQEEYEDEHRINVRQLGIEMQYW
jgi:hypothetical protein